MHLLKTIFISSVIFIAAMLPMALPAAAGAAANIQGSLCGAAQDLSVNSSKDCTTTSGSESRFKQILADVINVFSIVVGVAAVIMVIFGGFKYITSGGNQESVKSAKQTLLYALIGIIIVALAQIIVKFVFNEATKPVTSAPDCSAFPKPPSCK